MKRVVHLLPLDLGRGAQNYAVALRARLDGPEVDHRIMTLFRAPDRGLEADATLDVEPGRLRSLGLDPRVCLRLRRRILAERPDAVVAHGGEPYKYARIALPGDVPLLYYRIGVSQDQATTGLRQRAHRFLLRRADLVAGVSRETLDDAEQVFGVDPDRLRLVPNGRDPERFEAARGTRPTADETPPRLISVGALTPGKRPGWFVELAASLRREGLRFDASLVGEGPLLDQLRRPAADAGVELLGHRSDVPELLAQADIFCFVSGGESEGMPGVLIEAGLAGLPTVATRVAGASTVIAEGETGFVVSVDDPEPLHQAVKRLIEDPELRADMGRAALARCEKEFTLAASTNRFRDVLDELLVPAGRR